MICIHPPCTFPPADQPFIPSHAFIHIHFVFPPSFIYAHFLPDDAVAAADGDLNGAGKEDDGKSLCLSIEHNDDGCRIVRQCATGPNVTFINDKNATFQVVVGTDYDERSRRCRTRGILSWRGRPSPTRASVARWPNVTARPLAPLKYESGEMPRSW